MIDAYLHLSCEFESHSTLILPWDGGGCDHMVVEFITTYAISAHHH
jgi:hypothetical protein